MRGRIEAVLDWATARGFRTGENPARWRGHLDKLLPRRSKVARVKHHAALPWREIPDFMAALREQDSVSARALEFTILSPGRTGATIGARWSEIDMVGKVWTVPRERAGTKLTKDHRVPLPDRALAILEGLPREDDNPHVFIGGRKGKGLSSAAMSELLKGMGHGPERATVHGFRSTFKDWATETTAYSGEVSEMALAHVVKDKTEAAYRRGELFEKRGRLMADWATFCASSPRAKEASVVPIRQAAREARPGG